VLTARVAMATFFYKPQFLIVVDAEPNSAAYKARTALETGGVLSQNGRRTCEVHV
jgi:hypothetical protein